MLSIFPNQPSSFISISLTVLQYSKSKSNQFIELNQLNTTLLNAIFFIWLIM